MQCLKHFFTHYLCSGYQGLCCQNMISKRYFYVTSASKLRYNYSQVSNTKLQDIEFDNSKMSGNVTDMQMWQNDILSYTRIKHLPSICCSINKLNIGFFSSKNTSQFEQMIQNAKSVGNTLTCQTCQSVKELL